MPIMKTCFAVIAVALLGSNAAHATVFSRTATVAAIRSHDSSAYPVDADQFTLTGFTSAGTCRRDAGLVALMFHDGAQGNRQMAIVNAALLAGKPITVFVDDALNTGGWCFVRDIWMR